MMRFVWGLALLLPTFLGGQPAYADEVADDARAKELYREGQGHYAAARYADAISAFQEAYELSGRPILLYNLATAQEREGSLQAALESLELYRPSAALEELDAIDRRISSLRSRLDQEARREAELAEAREQSNNPVVIVQRRGGPPAAAIGLFGLGAVGVGSGTYFTVRALGARSDWTGQCVEADPRLCPAKAESSIQRDKASSVIADVSWVVGLAAVGGGVVLSLGKKGTPEASDLVLEVGPNTLGLGGRF